MNNTFFVYDYHLNGNNDDEAIARCISDAKKAESRTVVFDRKDWLVSTAVLLPSDTEVIIDGCTVKQADFTYDNVFRGDNLVLSDEDKNGTPLDCLPIRNIKIIGKNGGRISGPDKNRVGFHPVLGEEQETVGDFWGWRTLMVSLTRCEGFEIGGLTFEKSRCWTMSFDICSGGYIHDLNIFTDVKNGDGIDFRSGCHDCKVENIYGKTSDDTVACTALYKPGRKYPDKNYLYTLEPGRCIDGGSERKDIYNITIRNVKSGGKHHGIICLAANGCKVHDITIENISEDSFGEVNPHREATVKIYTGYGTYCVKGDIRDISVKNVRGCYADYAVYSNAEAENVTLENITHENENAEAIKLDFPEGFTVIA